MSTAVITQPAASSHPASQRLRERSIPVALITMLTALAFAVHGYHPYAEDGGLYTAGIKHLLNPSLYPYSLPFVEAHLRFSLFAPAVAAAVRLTHLGLGTILLCIYLASIWVTLFAIWLLADLCYPNPMAQTGAVMLATTWLTIPVAGTSLILMDPYVTARSISLPCMLLALAAVLSILHTGKKLRSLTLGAVFLFPAAVTHPLMAAYALGDVLLLLPLLSHKAAVRRWGTVTLCLLALVLAGALQLAAPHDSTGYVQIAFTRPYWFLSQWQWYEVVGLVAPLLILAAATFSPRQTAIGDSPHATARRALTTMAVAVGTTAMAVSLAFAHQPFASHIVARLQPLRTFQLIYVLMILILGATLGEYVLLRNRWRWIAAFTLFGGILFAAQRSTYPSSAHIEWPGSFPRNQWEQAFLWIRHNTPTNALFAMDANYISLPGEDAQSFRAITERSALPDYSKDGGEASITPKLTDAWLAGQRAQAHLSLQSDTERLANLRPSGVNWIVLQQQARTTFDCPYQNDLVKVCRLP